MPDPLRPTAGTTLFQCATAISVWAFAATTYAWSSDATDVEVYTTRSIAVDAPAGVTVVKLDTAGAIEAELSAKLPSDPARAVAVARERLRQGGADLQRSLAVAYEQIAEAWSLGVTTLPAVVVDGRYVVYGEPDAARAIAKIEAFRREQP